MSHKLASLLSVRMNEIQIRGGIPSMHNTNAPKINQEIRRSMIATALLVLLTIGMAAESALAAMPDTVLEPDPRINNILEELDAGEGTRLPPFNVIGHKDGLDAFQKFRAIGPGRRDYSNKWVWAKDRQRALYCGGNHGTPHKFNDVWEFDLAANTWRMLYSPDPGVETMHTWWALTYDSRRNELLWMAIDTGSTMTWPTANSVNPPLVSWTPSMGWESISTSSAIRANAGGAMEYVPSLDAIFAHNQNWNGSGTQMLDRSTGEWTELASLRDTYFSDDVSPGREAVINHDPDNNVLVGFRRHGVYIFDLSSRKWSKIRSDLPISVHDAGTASDFGNGKHWLHDEDRLFTYDYDTNTLTEHNVPALGGTMGYYDHSHGVFVLYNGTNRVYVFKD